MKKKMYMDLSFTMFKISNIHLMNKKLFANQLGFTSTYLTLNILIMASSIGIEPTTYSLGGSRSILLSYEDINYINAIFTLLYILYLYNIVKSVVIRLYHFSYKL